MGKRIYEYWYGNYGFELKIKISDALDCSHPGPCDSDIAWLADERYIESQRKKIDPEKIRKELCEYGAWDDEELKDDDENWQRILWIACGDIADEIRSADNRREV